MPSPTRRRVVVAACLAAACSRAPQQQPDANGPSALDLAGAAVDPLASEGDRIHVLVFVTPDCPLSNRYAPELGRIAADAGDATRWWMVYPDPDVDAATVRQHHAEYGLPGTPLRDPQHALVARVAAKVTPEAAVFAPTATGPSLAYHGRIDDRVPAFGRARPTPSVRDLHDALVAIAGGGTPSSSYAEAVGCPIGDLR